jgi:hypothetical protein
MRGAAPVGHLLELPDVEQAAVACLRLWCDGTAAQARLWGDLAGALGPGHGRTALKALERLLDLIVTHGRRPLMRHGLDCRCVGGDECAFAHLVAAAAGGEREDALLMASLLVPPGLAPEAVELAGQFGLGLRRMAVSYRPAAGAPEARPEVLH